MFIDGIGILGINQHEEKRDKIKKIIIIDSNDDVYIVNSLPDMSSVTIDVKNPNINSISYYNCPTKYDIKLHATASANEYEIIKGEGQMILDGIKSFLDGKIKRISELKKMF